MNDRNRISPIIGALMAVSLGVGSAAENGPGGMAGLEGIDWQLVQFRSGDVMQDVLESNQVAVLRFADGRLSGSAGCNRLMGAYQGDGNLLSFEPNIAATMMACPPPLMAQEQAVVDALGQAASFRIEGHTLHIDRADGQGLLTLAEQSHLPLTGTHWRLTWYNNGKQAIVSALKDTAVMLQLQDDGQFAGQACNSYRGGFEQAGRKLHIIGPIAATRMVCRGPDGASEQESAYFAALERVFGFRISGDELTLTDAEGTIQAKFSAEAP
ncbi:MAG: META domain-containing protein [Thiohalocapsa sp.]